ncbi:MAG: hypothetical protein S4CHLAM81_11150 [Chlamydiales bacterium]|nr:hypothetical protein [Chlamydiales bacterium]MCH9635893.1 hypothetical protein [Chlamydiales bacterium]MCH9703874.1 YXWGXW repeat-containing protein [Chlamydiota bacterium]
MRYFLLLFFLPIQLFAEASALRDHMVHEAFLPPEQDQIILQAVPIKPPEDITERTPKSEIKNAVWIPGYWNWSGEHDRYVWISGTRRVPPPGHEWIEGKWKHYDEGWVWLHGFWSPHAEKDLSAISRPPPDRVDEAVQNPPGQNYFWLPGHWIYSESEGDFVWYTGRWQEFDESWQYVPAHYVWRDKGYIFIEGYWDWNLNERGEAYAAVEIPHDEIATISYLPHVHLSTDEICHIYYPCWPDYYMTFHYWCFFHPDFDFGWGAVPVWWDWPAWWAFNGVDMWWLWWWWTHPGFAHPFFITPQLAAMILPPNALILHQMQSLEPLPFITPSGVINLQDLVHAIENFTGHSEPILPSSPESVFQIQEEANPTRRPTRVLKPTADSKQVEMPSKPFFGPQNSDFSKPTRKTPQPTYPEQVKRPPIHVVKPKSPVRSKPRSYEVDVDHDVPKREPRRAPPHMMVPRNNTRVRPPHSESYSPKPRYQPHGQEYKPRRAPQTYKPSSPTKRQYQPRTQTSPHPTYKAPSRTPKNGYRQLK